MDTNRLRRWQKKETLSMSVSGCGTLRVRSGWMTTATARCPGSRHTFRCSWQGRRNPNRDASNANSGEMGYCMLLCYFIIITYVMLYDIYDLELYFDASCCRTCHVLLMNSMKNLPSASSLLDYVTTCTLQWPEAPKKLNALKWKHCHQCHLFLSFVKAIANPSIFMMMTKS